jgi:hypothetical protein
MGPKFLLTGTSSGKLMRSVMCGSPVITSSFVSYDLYRERGCRRGILQKSPQPSKNLSETNESTGNRERCLSFGKKELIREQESWEALVTALRVEIDLRKATYNQPWVSFDPSCRQSGFSPAAKMLRQVSSRIAYG